MKKATWDYFMAIASRKVTSTLIGKDKEKFFFDTETNIWRYYGRLLERREIEVRDMEIEPFYDSQTLTFVHPVGLATDPLIFQIIWDLHWNIFPHKGIHATNRVLAQFLYVIKGGHVVQNIRQGCQRCRRILKQTMEEKMGEIPMEKLIVSPAFSFSQIDTAGPFYAFSRHNFRSKVEVNALVISCITTSATNILALELLDGPSIVKALLRHSFRHGYISVGFIDLGPGLVKGCNAVVQLSDYAGAIRGSTGMRVIPKPPQNHQARGKVERAVQAMKSFFEDKKLSSLTQSVLDWETSFACVSNYLNNLPVARINRERNLSYDVTDVISPNRLLLGRNNQRNPNFLFEENDVGYSDRVNKNSQINRSWFTLLNRLVPDLVARPKWHKTSLHPPRVGDYVLFRHIETSRAGKEHEIWKTGYVFDIIGSECSSTAILELEYKALIHAKEKKTEDCKVATHTTRRALREVVLLFTEEEIASPPGSPPHLARLNKSLNEPKPC